MVLNRICSFRKQDGERCRSTPMRESELCFWHDPEHAEEADQARKLGGQRRRREKITEGAYDLEGLDTVEGIRRLIEIAMTDTLSLENSVSRSRTLIAGASALAQLLKVAEQDELMRALENAISPRAASNRRR